MIKHLLQCGVSLGSRWRSLVDNPARRHDDELVGLQRHVQFVKHADDRDPIGDLRPDDAQPIRLVRRVKVSERFVHQ